MPAEQRPRLRPVSPSEAKTRPGTLLIAPPMMRDPNFRRAVIMICDHSDEGSFGLIMNRPLSLTLGEVLRGMDGKDAHISLGGPVQTDTLHFLHRHGDIIPDAVHVLGDVYWGGDFDVLKLLIETGQTSAADLRFFLGYAGWSPGQLADELQRQGWMQADGDADTIFPADAKKLWGNVLRRMGGDYALLSNFPEDPRMN